MDWVNHKARKIMNIFLIVSRIVSHNPGKLSPDGTTILLMPQRQHAVSYRLTSFKAVSLAT
jgi:hypothetical protein